LQSCSPTAHRPDPWCGTAFDSVEEAVAAIEFMRRHNSGVICVSLPGEVRDRLELPLMVERGAEGFGTAFTITVDKRDGITAGISASDRAATLLCRSALATVDRKAATHLLEHVPTRPLT
jgi:3,4-dihydroxy-2-butanone 4-phosphate synthase